MLDSVQSQLSSAQGEHDTERSDLIPPTTAASSASSRTRTTPSDGLSDLVLLSSANSSFFMAFLLGCATLDCARATLLVAKDGLRL
jgi:hypothetical protein